MADPEPAGWRRPRLVWIGAAAILAAVALRSVLAPPALESEASTLDFAPAEPAPGAVVLVVYAPTPRLDGPEALRLRARFRHGDDLPRWGDTHPQEVATLFRGRDGRYRGSFQLPADVAFGVFAVEDSTGSTVDSHGRVGWPLLTYAGGTPSLPALIQRAYDAFVREPHQVLEYTRQMTKLYPDSVRAWETRTAVELELSGEGARARLTSEGRDRLRRFDGTLRGRAVSPAAMASMYFFAQEIGAAGIADWWRTRLLQDSPASASAVEVESMRLQRRGGSDPVGALRGFDSLWVASGGLLPRVAQDAFYMALGSGDARTLERWARRWRDAEPASLPEIARAMADDRAVADTALVWLREAADELRRPYDARRPLYRTVAEQRASDEQDRRRILLLEGKVALAAGHHEAGIALLDSALRTGWDLTGVSDLAEARISAGDTVGGVEMLARLSADPYYDNVDVRNRGSSLVAPALWNRLVDEARQRLLEETRREAKRRALPPTVPLRLVDGTDHDLRALTAGRVTVVVFLYQCVTCEPDLERFWIVEADSLGGAQVLVVTDRRPTPDDIEASVERGIEYPVFVDVRGAVADALESWARPDYFVIDGRGTILFSYSTPEDIPRQVLAAARPRPFA